MIKKSPKIKSIKKTIKKRPAKRPILIMPRGKLPRFRTVGNNRYVLDSSRPESFQEAREIVDSLNDQLYHARVVKYRHANKGPISYYVYWRD